jgi:alpha-tubulin suppressor-like RCC1 family protein
MVDICCGYAHCLAISEKNDVYIWGYNKYGQLGNGNMKID